MLLIPTRHRRLVPLPQLTALGPVEVSTTFNREGVRGILDAQHHFGGSAQARIVSRRVDGRRSVFVVLRYTSMRVTSGELPPEIAEGIGWRVRMLALTNRVVSCDASIVDRPDSESDLAVILNPKLS